jgi:hypothetical protein
MVDVIDMLDAFEAKRKRQPKVTFEIEKWRIGDAYYVRATLSDGTIERIESFATEGEAAHWIRNEPAAWLRARSRQRITSGREANP